MQDVDALCFFGYGIFSFVISPPSIHHVMNKHEAIFIQTGNGKKLRNRYSVAIEDIPVTESSEFKEQKSSHFRSLFK